MTCTQPQCEFYEAKAVESMCDLRVRSHMALSTSAENGGGGFLMRHLQCCSNEALFSQWPLKAEASIVKE